jgi:hypothetical protein
LQPAVDGRGGKQFWAEPLRRNTANSNKIPAPEIIKYILVENVIGQWIVFVVNVS